MLAWHPVSTGAPSSYESQPQRLAAIRGQLKLLADALPALQRAVEIAEPLEGVVERVGRLADRLPGGRRISAQAPHSGDDEEAMPRGTA